MTDKRLVNLSASCHYEVPAVSTCVNHRTGQLGRGGGLSAKRHLTDEHTYWLWQKSMSVAGGEIAERRHDGSPITHIAQGEVT